MNATVKRRCAIAVFFPLLSVAQQKITVVDEWRQPIAKASITLVRPSGETAVYTASATGEAVVRLEGSEAVVHVDADGFEHYEKPLEAGWKDTIVLRQKMLKAVCVTAQYRPTTPRNAVQKVTLISKATVTHSGSNNLSDVLAYQTGIRIQQDPILGSALELGGMSGQNVKILVDGVPVIGRKNGNIDLSQVNLNNVERIEVIEGPLAVNYGSNALAGTVNVITQKTRPNGITAEVNPYFSSVGDYNLTFSTGVKVKAHRILLSGGRNYFDGWSAADPFFQFPRERLADTNRFKTWKPKEQYMAELQYSGSLRGWQWRPYLRYFHERIVNRGRPAAPYYASAFDDEYRTRRAAIGIATTKEFKASKGTFLLAYNQYHRNKHTFYRDLTTLEKTLSTAEGAQDTSQFTLLNGRLTYQVTAAEKWNYQLGIDIALETARGANIRGRRQGIDDYAAFVTAEWKPTGSLIVRPGLRYAYNTVYPAPLIPSLNTQFQHGRFTLRGAVAKGFRSPTLKELYFDFVDVNHNIQGNEQLRAEHSWHYSLHADWEITNRKGRLATASLGSYYNDVTDLITLGTLDEQLFTYLNIGAFRTIGSQMAFSLESRRWNWTVNGTYIGRYQPDAESSSKPLFTFSPEIGSQLGYEVLRKRLSIHLFYKFNGALQRFYLNQEQQVESAIQSPFSLLDASVTAHLLKERTLQLTVGMKNLFNVRQVAFTGQAQGVHSSNSGLNAGRGVFLFTSLKYRLNHVLKNSAS